MVKWLKCAGQVPERKVAVGGGGDEAHGGTGSQEMSLRQTICHVFPTSQKSELASRGREMENLKKGLTSTEKFSMKLLFLP